MIRVVASDLDGTLLRSDGTVSERTVRALRAVEQRGAAVVLATARPPRSVRPLVDILGCRGLALCANGALVYDAAAAIGLGVEQGLVSRRDPHYESPFAFKDSVEVVPVEECLHEPVSKVYAAYPGSRQRGCARRRRRCSAAWRT